ncbi:gamma-glutamyltransferase [Pseudomonas flexibilis]|uniref:gamma-glutamyltransferase n=1 Tax=Pseudomonas flexibilis TaxID=706570 RepID=UPI00068D4012|nr:gamma-glutamyltransferase [Pseudomonas flexibilis]SCX97539.1 gamma-glutamyltransferase 1 . Threonine peptidase. MEROPS family T03 [Pseudomonas flexibilis]
MTRLVSFLLLSLSLFSISPLQAARLEAAAVAAPDRHSAEVAAQVLRRGGNAVDAAVATGFALAVTHPEAGNIGGGGFMTLVVDGQGYFLDYREMAPQGARRDMYLDESGEVVADLSTVGARAAGVPGTVMGLWEAHRRFGSLPWAELLTPAIVLARQGFIVDERQVAERDGAAKFFAGRTNFDRYFGDMQAGKRFVQEELAQTLERIADRGPEDFYRGRTAELLVAQMQRSDGLISATDLHAYRAIWREPLRFEWQGQVVYTAPPPSSGGIALAQLLGIKALRAQDFAGVPLNSARYVHLLAEIEKRVFADRADYLGDPDYFDVPTAQLTAPEYLQRRAAEIDPQRISPTEAVRPGLESPQTTHFSIIDADGNAVSNTYTLNLDFGNGLVVEGAGFLLNNEMDDFSAKPGVANAFGVIGSDANAIDAGKRMLSSMSPTILTRDSQVTLAVGTPGGSRIFTTVFQVLSNLYDHGLPLPEALKAQRVHHQLLPRDTIFLDPHSPLKGSAAQELRAMGYILTEQGWPMGDVQAVQVLDGRPLPASDPRGRGQALVVEVNRAPEAESAAPAAL